MIDNLQTKNKVTYFPYDVDMRDYQAIGFDYGGVIAGRRGQNFNSAVCKYLGITEEQYKTIYFRHNQKVNTGQVNWPKFWKIFLDDLGQPEKLSGLIEISDRENASLTILNQDVLQVAAALKSNGYKTGILSNNTQENAKIIHSQKLEAYFDVIHISAETGFVKPDAKAFQHLANALSTKLNELVFIDDSQNSLKTAHECGFTLVLFKNVSQLKTDLKQLGVRV